MTTSVLGENCSLQVHAAALGKAFMMTAFFKYWSMKKTISLPSRIQVNYSDRPNDFKEVLFSERCFLCAAKGFRCELKFQKTLGREFLEGEGNL